jgi:predicted porin
MKKSLFALAAAVSFGTAAHAQSNVTIYGIMDLGYMNQKSDGAGTSPTSKASSSYFGQGAEQTSRLGFRGNEDLGGGNSAFFTVETALQPNNATASTWTNRQSFVGLKKDKVGQFAIGTQYTPIFNQLSITDVGQTNQMPGSAVYPQVSTQNNGNPGTKPFASPSSPGNATDAFTTRTSNTLTIKSADFSGFKVGAALVQNGSTTTPTNTAATTNNYTGWGLQADYTLQKLYVGVAYQALKSSNTSPSTTITSPTPEIWAGSSGGLNTQDNQSYAAATYDFGILKGYLQYVNRKVTSTINSSYYAKRSAQQIGVRSYMTPVIEGWASIGNGSVNGFGRNLPTANFVAWQTGLNYYLSKRTNLYGIYGTNNMSSAAPVNPALNTSAFAIGVRHTF